MSVRIVVYRISARRLTRSRVERNARAQPSECDVLVVTASVVVRRGRGVGWVSERAVSADVCVVPRASRQRLGGSAGVRRRLYSLQQAGAEVCGVVVVVVIIVRRRRERGRRTTRLNRQLAGFVLGMQV